MKYEKAKSKLLYSYGVVVLIVTLLLIEYATPYVVEAYHLHWLILVIVLMLCFSPFGNMKLIAKSQEKPRHSFWRWLGQLFLLQISLFFVFIGMTLVFSHWLPLTSPSHPLVITRYFETFLKHDGLFPWALYALYAGGLGYISYIKNEDAYISSLALPFFKAQPTTLLSNILNMQARSAAFIVLTATFAFMTLLIASVITPPSMPLLTGFHGKTLIIITALIVLGFTPPFKKIVRKLLNPKIPLWIATATTLILFALLIWLLNAFFGHLGEAPIQVPSFIQWLERKNPNQLWLIFSAAWWIGWTPTIAAHIARLSRGYRIRSILLATLVLPFVFTLLLIEFPAILSIFDNLPITASFIAIIAFMYLLMILTEKMVLPILIRSYLPRRDLYKHRDHSFYFRKSFQMMLVLTYLYLPTGMSITMLVIFSLTLSFTIKIPFDAVMLLLKYNKTS